jgi:hypothetical protein
MPIASACFSFIWEKIAHIAIKSKPDFQKIAF